MNRQLYIDVNVFKKQIDLRGQVIRQHTTTIERGDWRVPSLSFAIASITQANEKAT